MTIPARKSAAAARIRRGVALLAIPLAAPAIGSAPRPALEDAHVDEYFGLRVADPFRWLERLDAPEVGAWARAHDEAARSWLATESPVAEAQRAVDAMSSYRKVGDLVERGGRRFYLVVEPGRTAPSLWLEEPRTGARRELLAPAPAPDLLVDYAPSPSGERLAYALAAPGQRVYEWRFLDVASGQPLSGSGVRGRIATRTSSDRNPWSPAGDRFVYAEETPGSSGSAVRRVVAQTVGGGAGSSVLHECAPAARCEAVVTGAGGVVVRDSGADGDTLWLYPPRGGARTRLAGGAARYELVGARDGRYYVLTDEAAAQRRIDVVAPADTAGSGPRPLVAEPAAHLEQAHLFGGRLVLLVSQAGRQSLRVHALDGAFERTVALPDGLVWNLAMRHWSGLTGDPEARTVFVRCLGPTSAGSIHALDLSSGELRVEVAAEIPLALENLTSEQVVYPSADGVDVPMFLVRRRDAPAGEAARVLLFVYGAFGWTARPFLNAKYAAWLDAGGVIAMPNVRGDGIHGPAWHEAGRGARKENSVRDLVAAAEWLIESGHAARGRIALDANSAGTVTAAAALLRRPELFGAALLEVPISDLLRATALPGGENWGDELGAPASRADAERLLALSPYHRALAARCPPPTFVTAGDLDTTAVPSHAYKLAAALERAGGDCDSPSPVLLRVDWGTDHGANKPESQRRAEWAAELAFLDAVMAASPASPTREGP